MKRRNFLKSAGSVLPLALSQPFALATQSSDSPAREVHVVLAGQDIDNENRSLGFSRISLKISTRRVGVFPERSSRTGCAG
jgi:hypothetical protein